MRNYRLSAAAATIAFLSMFGSANAAPPSAEHGKIVFMKKGCWECHGTQGQGAITGPRLAPDPLPYDALAGFVRSTSRAMPPYHEEILSDADLTDLYAYLQSIPKPQDVKSIPLLNQWADKPK